ncbi:MAG: hypothetical protein JWP91_2308 [Fibrobacteres bacterium]|nr:hypothetical protein [Fibrobacterota bacterium]
MPFPQQTLLIALCLAAYVSAVFFALPYYLLTRAYARWAGRPDRLRIAVPVVRFLIPGLLSIILIIVFFLATSGDNWLENYVEEANQGREWALFILFGEVMALSGWLGSVLLRYQKAKAN